jgi:hypothetical protein
MRLARALSAGTTAALSLGAFTVVVMASAPPASAAQTNVPGNAASSWQTNDTVWAIASANGNVYLGGQFTSVRPPDAAPGTGEVARARLAALNASTGALVTSFNHNVNGTVYSAATSPDGKRLYIGGDFSAVDGATRNRIAAFDTGTGALLSWAPSVNARVTTISASATGVYIGGSFSSAGGRAAQRLAELDATTGAAVPGFTAAADAYVYSIALSVDFSRLFVAGTFTTLNGDPSDYAAGMLDAATGAALPFPANSVIPRPSPACNSVSKVVRTDADGAYFGNEGTGGGCFDGTFAANLDGSLKWVSTCLGATQAVQPVNGTLYTGSHAHDCSQDKANGDPLAFKEVGWNRGLSRHLEARSTTNGHMTPWLPNTNGGASGGLGPRVMGTDGTQLFVGGEFTTVNGRAQQGFARFSPATGDLTTPATPAAPTAVARSGGKVSIFVQAPLDLDDIDMTLRLYRDGGSTPIATKDVRSFFQQQPVVAFSDDGQAVGSSHTYRVDAVEDNGTNASARSAASNSVTVVNSVPSYEASVLADNPSLYWRMSDTHGTAIADSSPAAEGGTTWGTLSYSQGGAVSGNNAIAFDGTTASIASTDSFPSPSTYTVSAWFRTTSTSGGKIIGFGDDQQGWDFNGNAAVSGQYDKHIYMTNDGRLVFGVYNGSFDMLTTSTAYNDGQWHQVVGTQGPTGMAFYVDGGRVGRNGVTTNQNYTGYWRVGGDNLGAWPNQPASNFFNGAIDEVAVYDHVLSLSDVTAQYAASGRTPPPSNLPTDDYGKAVVQSGATSFWRVDETSGIAAADSSGNGNAGTYSGGYTLGGPSAIGSFGRSFSVDGSSGNLASANPTSGPNVYSEELWFKTGTTSGGKLIGFGNVNNGLSGNYDRHVYMLNDGRLRFGVWNGQADTVTSASSYNDNQWHYMVATQSSDGMRLYVDGGLVGNNGVTTSQPYGGYWRVGGDNLNGWPDQPSSVYFNGAIDEVATYEGIALAPADIAAHYAAAGHTGPDIVPPTTSITAPVDGATVSTGSVTVQADAADNVGVTSVALKVDGSTVATDTSAPYSFTWNAGAGSHQLQTVASDAAGNSGTSAVVTVTAQTPDTTAPTTSITSPHDGDTVDAGTVNVSATASDNVGVTSVTLLVDGSPVGTDTAGPYTFSWNAAAGSHTLQTRATDAAGNSGDSAAVHVTAVVPPDNQPPSAPGTLTGAASDTTTVQLHWGAATDNVGVTAYQVVRDGAVVAGNVAGLGYTDTNRTPGASYAYTVRAVDAAGNVGPDSNTLNVTMPTSNPALFSETWPGADGSAWPSAWTTSASNGTADTQSGTGRLAFNDVTNAYARAQLTGNAARSDSEVLLSYQWSANTAGGYLNLFLRGSGGWQNAYRPLNGYGVQFASNSGTVTVQKNVNGTVTNLRSVSGAQAVSTAKQWVRLRVSGSTIELKTWRDGQAEPAAWTATLTDSSVTAAGQLYVSLVRSAANSGVKSVALDDLQLFAG